MAFDSLQTIRRYGSHGSVRLHPAEWQQLDEIAADLKRRRKAGNRAGRSAAIRYLLTRYNRRH